MTLKGIGPTISIFVLAKVVVIVFVILSALYLTPYGTNTELWLHDSGEPTNGFDMTLRTYLSPLARWDAVYFLCIARDGYNFEQQHAFFPLYPFLMRKMAELITKMVEISLESALLISGVLISNVSHFFFVIGLYRLTRKLGGCERMALTSTVFAACSPALAFLSSISSESFFGLLGLIGFLLFYSGWKVFAMMFWFLASLTRSNGVLFAGFFLYDALIRLLSAHGPKRLLIKDLFCAMGVISGLILFGHYGYSKYCTITGNNNLRPWCGYTIPNIYDFVQKHYWNVGFLRYFSWHQLPNFLIAAPTLIASICMCWWYVRADKRRFWTLGSSSKSLARKVAGHGNFFIHDRLLPHVYLMCFLLLYTITFIHVQIVARLFAFQPLFYWGLAHVFWNSSPKIQKLLSVYILGFAFIGTLLYTNSYPPA